ncbi:protein FAR1-RELATED SEQUENCE 2-like [Helianthus annuus]|uniref:protein FAR1-RELATED SEQUENCE 2-like n=1 Tax=Helianthus annuus TaxID=4232 RepID=UPI001652F055|nr:protein FAR1-RELATED SEQUENCE 2-like [Helianthus annuus]
MVFSSLDDCYSMYVKYAKECGFSVRKGTTKTNFKGVLHTKYYLCTRSGLYKDKKVDTLDPNQKERVVRSNFSKRTDYGALLCVLLEAGSWKVYKFVEEQNHELVERHDKHFLPTERHLTQLLYSMVFVPLTGIDNHHCNVTFGAALLASETADTYIWLLRVFLKVVGSQPKVVVTDQDPAMKKAISVVFVDRRHRLCMWHVMHKLSLKVGVRLCNSTNFKERICGVVWTDILTPEELESEWEAVIAEFNLEDNDWLSDIFALRESWIPAYNRMEQMSGLMRTTSRSESENHFFCQVCNSKATLVDFMTHYETSIEAQPHTHLKNDHESRYKKPKLKSSYKLLEGQAVDIYTKSIFCDTQAELIGVVDCINQRYEDQPDGFVKYYVNDFQQPYKHSMHGVIEILFFGVFQVQDMQIVAPPASSRDRFAEIAGQYKYDKNPIRVPVGYKSKGSGSRKRLESKQEIAIDKQKSKSKPGAKERECQNCKGYGHYASTCKHAVIKRRSTRSSRASEE